MLLVVEETKRGFEARVLKPGCPLPPTGCIHQADVQSKADLPTVAQAHARALAAGRTCCALDRRGKLQPPSASRVLIHGAPKLLKPTETTTGKQLYRALRAQRPGLWTVTRGSSSAPVPESEEPLGPGPPLHARCAEDDDPSLKNKRARLEKIKQYTCARGSTEHEANNAYRAALRLEQSIR